MVKRIPKAKDVNLGLANVPKWLSGVKIPSILVKTFGINPGQIGGLTLESKLYLKVHYSKWKWLISSLII